jgi:hypothetical protein
MPRKALQTAPQPEVKVDFESVFAEFDGDDALIKAKAAHRVACGLSNSKIAEELGLSLGTLKTWRTETSFNNAVEIIKSNFGQYIQAGMSHHLVQADEFVGWILSLDPFDPKIPKDLRKDILREKGLAAREIYKTALPADNSQKGGTVINISQPVFNMAPGTAEILAGRLTPEIIEIEEEKPAD